MNDEDVVRLRASIAKLARQLNLSSTVEGLTPSQASVLGLIVLRQELRLAELSELETLNPTMLSRVIGRLVEIGLVVRKPDPNDQRSVLVGSTPAGRIVDRNIKASRTAVVYRCLAMLPSDQVSALSDAVPALENLAETMRKVARSDRAYLRYVE